MRATADKSFPSHTIWRSHFGSKQDLIKRVMDYCSARDDLADVAAMYKAVTGTDPLRSHRERAIAETDGAFGHVYLIRSGKYYKIGRSNATGRREYELAIQLPEKTQKVHEIRTDDPVGIESYWHNRFAAKRRNGEWFELDAADVAVFKRRRFM